MTINVLTHPAPAQASAPTNTRAEHERAKFLDVQAFAVAERLAEGARQSAVAAAAAELQARGNAKTGIDFDRHNQAVHIAERKYLEAVISAADKHGVHSHGWKQTLATLPPPVPAQRWAEGKGKW